MSEWFPSDSDDESCPAWNESRPFGDCLDATGLSRGGLMLVAKKVGQRKGRCQGLVPWRFHVDASERFMDGITSVSLHGTSPWHPLVLFGRAYLGANVSLHGTSPWHQ